MSGRTNLSHHLLLHAFEWVAQIQKLGTVSKHEMYFGLLGKYKMSLFRKGSRNWFCEDGSDIVSERVVIYGGCDPGYAGRRTRRR